MKSSVRSTFCPIGALGVALLVLSHVAACDSTATISEKKVKYDRLQVVSTAPLVESADGALTRSCEVGADDAIGGLEVNFVFKATDIKQLACPSRLDEDLDLAVRPGDRIERARVIPGQTFGPDSLELDVQCVEPLPDPTPLTCGPGGADGPNMDIESLDWRPFYQKEQATPEAPVRCEPAAVVLLIDQSGSMRGLVDGANGYREDQEGRFPVLADTERNAAATDLFNARLAAAQDFVEKLNANDKLLVVGFNEDPEEGNLKPICDSSPVPAQGDLADAPEHLRKAIACFGVNRGIVDNALAQAYGDEVGRTPLWQAVEFAYEFLGRTDIDVPANRHIVVIGDGPDTCSDLSDEFIAERTRCSDVSYEDVRDLVTTSGETPGSVPVHIHFVQMQAMGYMARDPRQLELACLSEGHFQFINRREMTLGPSQSELRNALREAADRVRNSLSGYWVLAVRTAALSVTTPGAPGYIDPGSLFGVTGNLTLDDDDFSLVAGSNAFDASGNGTNSEADQRLSFRRMCDEDAQCDPAPNPCMVYCSAQQGVCLETPLELPEGTACLMDGGGAGVCCAGTCQATCDPAE